MDYNTHAAGGGSFPLIISGMGVIGTIAVSELPDYLDHQLIYEVIQECGMDASVEEILEKVL